MKAAAGAVGLSPAANGVRVRAEVATMDAHSSSGSGVAVLATGVLIVETYAWGYSGRFAQSFFLSPPNMNSTSKSATLYVMNETLRLLD